MQKTVNFKKKVIASAIASAIGFSGIAFAQDDAEEIVITGIKASLIRSEEIKRQASGVVDAISAEDMGKFPDSNLAESLQRITGVSIDRSNGEGSKVTVRGMGPEYNMVTLNGRQMPASGIQATAPNYTRAFDFSNLAADGVEALEVYKTGRADITSGGIGATINIKTPKPLDKPGFRAAAGVKGAYDTSELDTTHVTPEVSGLISDTFADDTIGVLFLGSYSERKNGQQKENQTNWFHQPLSTFNPKLVLTDNRADKTSEVFFPRSAGLELSTLETKRTNAQLVLQWAPSDALKTTLDYTYSGLEQDNTRTTFGAWFVGGQPDRTGGNNVNSMTLDKNGTAVLFEERGGDYSWDRWHDGSKNENNSIGFNADWKVTDTLDLVLDAHKSKAESKPLGGVAGNSAGLIMGDGNVVTKTFTVGSDIPTFNFVFATPNGEADPAKIATQFGFTRQGLVTSDVDQYQLKGAWKNADEGSALSAINFGVGTLDQTQESQFNGQFAHRSDWSYGGAELFDDKMFIRKSTTGLLDGLSRAGTLVPYYYDYDFDKVLAIAKPTWDKTAVNDQYGAPNPKANQFRTIEETSNNLYLQFDLKSEINGMPFKALAGVRWESTSTESTTLQQVPLYIQWTGPTERNVESSTDSKNVKGTGRYEVFLPSLDTSLDFTDDIKGRFSFSRTMARPPIGNLVADYSVGSVNNATASSGNPNLKPFLSDNIDISAEWYYSDASYISLGFFKKNIENFVTDESRDSTVPGLYDPTQGARAAAAKAALAAGGNSAPSSAEVLAQIRKAENLGSGPVIGNSTDPLFKWSTVTHVNNEAAKLWGLEFAVQHLFGESGFGTSFNYTKVNGDIGYDVKNFDFQFALIGLSDTANFSAFYEKHDVSVRVSYNWRDKFLNNNVDGAGTNNPVFTKAYGQVDLSASYNLTENLTFSLDALNLLDETQIHYGRYENQVIDANQYGARYAVGARYKF